VQVLGIEALEANVDLITRTALRDAVAHALRERAEREALPPPAIDKR
jgi:hypothetical protein